MGKDLSAKIIINAEDRTGGALAKTTAGLKTLDQQLAGIKARLSGFLALSVGGVISQQIGAVIRTADAYKTLEARLKLVSDNSKEYAVAQKELFNIAQRSRGDLQATATLYGKVETAIKQLGGSQQQALKTTETLNQAIALTSQGASQDAAAILQFSQALGSGVLRGDEFNSVMENSPGLAQALADGLGVATTQLRGMAEAGELTADKLVNALGKSAPKVAEQFAQLPVTVGGAMAQLNNAFTVFIGQTDKTTGASAKLAGGIQTIAKNLDTIADIGKIAAEIYGAKLVIGLSKSTLAMHLSAVAAKQKALADIQAREATIALLRDQTLLLQANVRNAHLNVEAAKTELALATTQKARASALVALASAQKAFDAAMAKSNDRQNKLNNVIAQGTVVVSKAEKAFGLLNGAISLAFSFDIGKSVGEWLLQFDKVKQAGSYVAEAWALAGSGIEAMFNGLSLNERFAQVQQIHAEFEQIRANSANGAQQDAATVANAEQQKTAAIEQAAQLQAESFKKVQEATQALTAQIDADAKTQTAAIQQALAEKTAAIDASDASDSQKDQLKLQAKLQAGQQELLLQQSLATEKLNLIEAEYAKELASAAANKDRLNKVETEKKQAKLSVYEGLAAFYQSEINKLQDAYNNEIKLAAQANKDIESLAIDHKHELLEIERLGFTDKQKLDSEVTEYENALTQIRQEQAKGKQGSQTKINELLAQARDLHGDITAAAVNGAKTQLDKNLATYAAQDRANALYKIQNKLLEDNAKAYNDNAKAELAALDDRKKSLTSMNDLIGEISRQLKEEMLVKIGIDETSFNSARAEINELTKPETKTITVQTIRREGSAAVGGGHTQTSDGVFSDVGQQTGGMAGRPTYAPWRFMTGGYAPKTGKLPGFGGGDKIKALLEAGEFVVRKEAVQKFGEPFLYAINAGRIPALTPIKRALGGSVGFNVEDEVRKKELERLQQKIKGLLNSGNIALSGLGSGGYSTSQAQSKIGDILDKFYNKPGLHINRGRVNEIIANTVGGYGDKENDNKFSRRRILLDHLFDEPANNKTSLPALPDAVSQFAQSPINSPSSSVSAPEVIRLDLSFNGLSASGNFPKSDQTRALLEEIKRAGVSSL